MKLSCVLIAEPKREVAESVAARCERLATTRLVATDAGTAQRLTEEYKPELVLLSLDLPGGSARSDVQKLLKAVPGLFLVAVYRELSVPDMERLSALGVEDFIAYPIDILEVFRAASRRFNVPFRRHDRYSLTFDVFRADGVLIGRTVDVSEGGMCMEAIHPVSPDTSILIDIAVPDGRKKPLRVRCQVLQVIGQPPLPVRAHLQFSRLLGAEQQRLIDYLAQQNADLISRAD